MTFKYLNVIFIEWTADSGRCKIVEEGLAAGGRGVGGGAAQ